MAKGVCSWSCLVAVSFMTDSEEHCARQGKLGLGLLILDRRSDMPNSRIYVIWRLGKGKGECQARWWRFEKDEKASVWPVSFS